MSKDNNKSTKTKAPKEQPKAPQAAAPKVSLDPAYIGRITGTLLAICAAVALLLKRNFRISRRDFGVLAGLSLMYAATSLGLLRSYDYIPSGTIVLNHSLPLVTFN